MKKIQTTIDAKTGLLTVTKSAGVHPFLRAGAVSDGAAPKLRQPYKQSVWVMSAIRHVADPVAGVPLVFSQDRRGGDTPLENPELTRFWERPGIAKGGLMRRADFVKASIGWVKLAGEFFWVMDDSWLVRGSKKSPLILARPDRMREVCDSKTGELVGWRYRDGKGTEQLLIPEQVIHQKNFNPYHDIRGLADWQAAEIAADADYAAGVFAKNLMASNGDRGPIVTADGNPSPEQIEQITRQLREKSIMSRRGEMKPIFLAGPNMKVQDPTVQAVDAAFVSQRLENRHEIYIAFGVPASFAEVAVSYSIGAASDYYRLIEMTCMPIAAMIADAIEEVSARFLGTDATLFAEFDFSEHSTMQQVRAERFDQAIKGVDRGMPWKDASNYLNLKLPRFAGDEVGRIPFNVQEIQAAPEVNSDQSSVISEDEEEKIDHLAELKDLFSCPAHGAHEPCKKDAEEMQDGGDELPERDPQRVALWENMLKRRAPWLKRFESRFTRHLMAARGETLKNIEANYQKSVIKNGKETKAGVLDLIFNLGNFLEGFLDGMGVVSRNAMETAGEEMWEDELDRDPEDDPLTMPSAEVMTMVQARQNHLAGTGTDIWNEVREAIGDGIEAGDTLDEISGRVRDSFNGISDERARRIAVTEVTAAYEAGRFLTLKEAGIEWKQWLSSGDERVRVTHLAADFQTVRINEFFKVGESKLLYPGMSGAPASEVINCRCMVVAGEAPKQSNNE